MNARVSTASRIEARSRPVRSRNRRCLRGGGGTVTGVLRGRPGPGARGGAAPGGGRGVGGGGGTVTGVLRGRPGPGTAGAPGPGEGAGSALVPLAVHVGEPVGQ